jgi:hypothetical protein
MRAFLDEPVEGPGEIHLLREFRDLPPVVADGGLPLFKGGDVL